MTHPETGETRWLGRFRAEINVSSNEVRLHNLDNPRNGRDHPHVSGGVPCFGGHHDAFSQLIAEGRWYVFLELAFQYLESFNAEDDWGQYAAYWFDVPDRTPGSSETEPDERPILAYDEDDSPIRDGDRVAFTDENGDHAVGVVEARPAYSLGWGVRRDDAPGYVWDMTECRNVRLERVAQAA
jgi:hypothetical protein